MKISSNVILGLSFALVTVGCTINSDGADQITPILSVTATQTVSATTTQAKNPASPGLTTTPVPESTEIPTMIPTATLSVAEAEQMVFDLFDNKAGCDIPCVWGITPGVSDTTSLYLLLRRLSPVTGSQIGGSAAFHRFSNGFDLTVASLSQEGVIHSIQISTHMFIENNGVIADEYTYDNSEYQEIMMEFLIDNILSKYGAPSMVLFRSFGLGAEDFPSETVLFYFDIGFSIQYTSPNSYIDDKISTCPWQAHISIETWDPATEGPDIADFKSPPLNFRELGSVTNLNAQSFYETFSIPTDSCIETQTDIWPLFPGQQSP